MAGTAARAAGLTLDEAERIAIAAIAFVTEDEARLDRFIALTGLSPATLAMATGRAAVLRAVLDHLMGDESLLLTFAANTGTDASLVAAAQRAFDTGLDV